ncbi:hypothetical protein LX36DRAFT_671241 [Colletotrichum falcatum]|nr:hypothetical protein LX36DRAFT_671241 [Colletotrichum falcatum]
MAIPADSAAGYTDSVRLSARCRIVDRHLGCDDTCGYRFRGWAPCRILHSSRRTPTPWSRFLLDLRQSYCVGRPMQGIAQRWDIVAGRSVVTARIARKMDSPSRGAQAQSQPGRVHPSSRAAGARSTNASYYQVHRGLHNEASSLEKPAATCKEKAEGVREEETRQRPAKDCQILRVKHI